MPSPSKKIAKLAGDINSYVDYLRENGVSEIVSFSTREACQTAAVKESRPINQVVPNPEAELNAITAEIAKCARCVLHKGRIKTVPGQGNPRPDILFIGEGPGEDEDRQGLAFVGAAGQLLTRLIRKMGYTREEVFISNIVKCRPPNNRKPLPEEACECLPYLERQIDVLRPKVIVLLGACALENLVSPEVRISKMRGKWLECRNIPTMPTFHPSYLLRNQSAMWDVWADMEKVLEHLGCPLPEKK
jgi:DNA polymerase